MTDIPKPSKSAVKLHKLSMFNDTATKAMDILNTSNTESLHANSIYLDELMKADSEEYKILLKNLEIADSPEERREIRDRMAEMKKERYDKDSENKTFLKEQQIEHRNNNLKILGAVAIASGLVVKYGKPLLKSGVSLLSKK